MTTTNEMTEAVENRAARDRRVARASRVEAHMVERRALLEARLEEDLVHWAAFYEAVERERDEGPTTPKAPDLVDFSDLERLLSNL